MVEGSWISASNKRPQSSSSPNPMRPSLDLRLWQDGLWSFQVGGTKLERFLHKNQQTWRKLLNFDFWINGELSKIGHHFSNRVLDLKIDFNKKCASELLFSIKIRLRKIRIIFYKENWLWKSNFGTFWQLAINPKLKIIFFEYVDF